MERALSGLVVVVPEAEDAVGSHRAALDDNARLGVPAHVTVLFPFAAPETLDEAVLQRVRTAVAAVPAFDYALRRTGWFGDDVLWLAPDEPAPFRELTGRVHAEFPEHPPFGGAFADVVPHLTVGHRHPRPRLAAAEAGVLAALPVVGRATEVTLLTQAAPGGRWSVAERFPLSPR